MPSIHLDMHFATARANDIFLPGEVKQLIEAGAAQSLSLPYGLRLFRRTLISRTLINNLPLATNPNQAIPQRATNNDAPQHQFKQHGDRVTVW